MERSGVRGGAVYDGLVALSAEAAGSQLLSLDRRAGVTYSRLGIGFRILD